MNEAGRRPSVPGDAPASTASSGRGRSGKAGRAWNGCARSSRPAGPATTGTGGLGAGAEETGLRDRLQGLALAHRHYGYRRLGPLLRREGWVVNHKRVLRLLREDNLLCLRKKAFVPATTDSRHGWKVHPNLARA